MFTDRFNTDGLFTMPRVDKFNELDMFCRSEGVNYIQLISEAHDMKNRPEKGGNVELFTSSFIRTR